MTCGIYQIKNIVDGKIYVGQSVDVAMRWSQHRSALRLGRHPNRYLTNAWHKYGPDAFVFEMLLPCDVADLTKFEQMALDSIPDGQRYNLAACAESAMRGTTASPETRAKQRAAKLGRKQSPETCARRSAGMMGHACPPTTRESISAANTGKRRTLEQKIALSIAHGGRAVVGVDDDGNEIRFRCPAEAATVGLAPGRIVSAATRPTNRYAGRAWHYVDDKEACPV